MAIVLTVRTHIRKYRRNLLTILSSAAGILKVSREIPEMVNVFLKVRHSDFFVNLVLEGQCIVRTLFPNCNYI